jgi:hypothetical protein
VPGSNAPFTTKSNVVSSDPLIDPIDSFFALDLDDDVIDCALDSFFNFPNPALPMNPLSYQQIRNAQQQQASIAQLPQLDPGRYSYQPFGDSQLVCYRFAQAHNWRVVVPDALLSPLVSWYHHVLNHTGMENLKQTINAVFYHPHMNRAVVDCVHFCSTCQQHKLQNRGYGQLPPREALFQPWYEVAIDSIGPWTIRINGEPVQFYAVTIIDTVTNLTKLVRVESLTAQRAATAMEVGWLHRYPRPVRVVHHQGPEYQGQAFSALLDRHGIKDVPISVRNPQANAICERMHQVVGNLLRTLLHVNPPQNFATAAATLDYALSLASHSLRAANHRTLGISPGALVFHRDMLMDVPYVANLLLLRQKRQALIEYNLKVKPFWNSSRNLTSSVSEPRVLFRLNKCTPTALSLFVAVFI